MDPGGRRSLERLMEGAGCPEAIADPVIKLSPIDISELVLDPDTFAVRPEQHARRTTSLDHMTLIPLVDTDGHPIEAQLYLLFAMRPPGVLIPRDSCHVAPFARPGRGHVAAGQKPCCGGRPARGTAPGRPRTPRHAYESTPCGPTGHPRPMRSRRWRSARRCSQRWRRGAGCRRSTRRWGARCCCCPPSHRRHRGRGWAPRQHRPHGRPRR